MIKFLLVSQVESIRCFMTQKFWIIQAGDNPSTDFFIKPELCNADVQVFNCFDLPPSSAPESRFSLVFVRYLSKAWIRWVERNRGRIDELIYFMDDDLFDLTSHKGLSLTYRWKLYYNALRYRDWLQKAGVKLWVSTPWLANKYHEWQPKLLKAKSPYADSHGLKTVFYHGSSSHLDEMLWLLPVIGEALDQDRSLAFEIIGGQKVRNLFSGLPRVNVLHPMNWESYKALCSRSRHTIGLAPLLNSSFNQARSFTKYYDITQVGAVGIYADHDVYRTAIRHRDNGLLVPMEPELWINAILELSHSVTERERMLENSRNSL